MSSKEEYAYIETLFELGGISMQRMSMLPNFSAPEHYNRINPVISAVWFSLPFIILCMSFSWLYRLLDDDKV